MKTNNKLLKAEVTRSKHLMGLKEDNDIELKSGRPPLSNELKRYVLDFFKNKKGGEIDDNEIIAIANKFNVSPSVIEGFIYTTLSKKLSIAENVNSERKIGIEVEKEHDPTYDKIKQYKEEDVKKMSNLKESKFGLGCDEDDLYKAVEKYAQKNGYEIERRRDSRTGDGGEWLSLHRAYEDPVRSFETNSNLFTQNMTEDAVKAYAKKTEKRIEQRVKAEFGEFCNKGLKGVVGTFKKGYKTIDVHVSYQITYAQMAKDKNRPWGIGDRQIHRCSGVGCDVINRPDEKTQNLTGNYVITDTYIMVQLNRHKIE